MVSCESGVELIAIVALTNSGKSCLSYQCLKKKKEKRKRGIPIPNKYLDLG